MPNLLPLRLSMKLVGAADVIYTLIGNRASLLATGGVFR